jgi:hypothetical protein
MVRHCRHELSLRTAVAVIAAGLISGVVAAAFAGHFMPGERPPSTPQPPMAASPALERVEVRMVPVPPLPVAPASRQEALAEHYQDELETRAQHLDLHAREPIDGAWARSQEQTLVGGLAALGEVRQVDCRSQTCAATLVFADQASALRTLRESSVKMAIEGCHGYTSVPTPAQGDGPYELIVLYQCR